MLICSPEFSQPYSPPPKAQSLISGQLLSVSLLKKGLDMYIEGGTITQQLSNSATQQLSNSATQQLRRKGGLCSDKRAAFFHQQRNFFLYAFTGSVLFSHHRHSRCYLLRHILHSSSAKPAFGQPHHQQSFASKREQCTVAYFFNRQDVYRIPPRMADIKNTIYFYQKGE